MRSLAVAESVAALGFDPVFITNDDRSVLETLKRYNMGRVHASFSRNDQTLTEDVDNAPVFIDIKNCPRTFVTGLRNRNCRVMLLDSFGPARLAADYVVYPGVQFDPESLDWEGKMGDVYAGAEYFPLRKELRELPELIQAQGPREGRTNTSNTANHILLSFGGTDPNNLSLKVLEAVQKADLSFTISVIIGPGFAQSQQEQIVEIAQCSHHRVQVFRDGSGFAQVIRDVDVCITAFGISVYEFNYFTIPVLLIQNYRKDSEEVKNLEHHGVAEPLGYYADLKPTDIRLAIQKCFVEGMPSVTQNVDGKGSERIGRILCSDFL